MDTKGPISPVADGNSYTFVIIDAFSHLIITNPTPHNNSNNQFKPYSSIGSPNLALLNVSH